MKTTWKWLRRLTKTAIVLLTLALLVQFLVFPAVARRAMINGLSGLGLSGIDLDVDRASPWQLRISDLRLGDGQRLSVGAIRSDYTPGMLREGRVRSVVVTGARYELRVREGKLDLGPLTALHAPARAATAVSAGSQLPLERLDVRSSALLLDWEGWRFQVPVEGSIRQAGPGRISIVLHSQAAGLPVRLTGTLEAGQSAGSGTPTTWQVDLRLDAAGQTIGFTGQIDPASGQVDLHAKRLAEPADSAGGLTLDGAFSRGPGRNRLKCHLAFQRDRFDLGSLGRAVRGEALVVDLKAELGDAWALTDVNGTLQARSLTLGETRTGPVDAVVGIEGDRVKLRASAAGPDWKLEHLTVLLPLDDLAHGRLPAAEARWDYAGALPAALAEILAGAGVEIQRVGGVQCAGRAALVRLAPAAGTTQPDNAWRVDLPEIRLAIDDADVALARPGISWTGLSTELVLKGSVDRGQVELALPTPGTVEWKQLTAGAKDRPIASGPLRLVLDADAQTALRLSLGSGENAESHLTWRLRSEDAVSVSGSGVEANAGKLASAGTLRWGRSGWTALGEVKVEQTRFSLPASQISLGDISATVPIGWNTAVERDGEFRIGSLQWRDEKFEALAGAVRLSSGRVIAAATWPVTEKVNLRAEAEIDLTGRQISGELAAKVPRFRMDDAPVLRRALQRLKGLELSGNLALDATLRIRGTRFIPRVQVQLDDARVASAAYDAAAEGISGTVLFDNLHPLSTLPGQRLAVRSAHTGKLHLTDGSVEFRVESPQSILVERTRWTLGQRGRFWVHAFRFNPTGERLDAEIFVENMNIKDLLGWFAEGQARGEGLVYGRIPVALSFHPTHIMLPAEGFLFAEPGTGWYEIQDRTAAENLLKQAEESVQTTIMNRAVAALCDFEYSTFQLQSMPSPDGAKLQIVLRGKGRQGVNPIEFSKLTINVNGLETYLDQFFRMERGTDRALDAALDRSLPR